MFMVHVPDGTTPGGLKDAWKPFMMPGTESVTFPENPYIETRLTVTLNGWLPTMVTVDGATVIEKSGDDASFTVSTTVELCSLPPPLHVTVR
jgi:hypothetical protein